MSDDLRETRERAETAKEENIAAAREHLDAGGSFLMLAVREDGLHFVVSADSDEDHRNLLAGCLRLVLAAKGSIGGG